MNRVFFIFLIPLLTSCSSTLYQVSTLESGNAKKIDSSLKYENDTVALTYSFWEQNGSLNIEILNKTEKPIFFDWVKFGFF